MGTRDGKMRSIIFAAALSLLVLAPTYGEESDASAVTPSDPHSHGTLAGYTFGTNVDEHKKIDLDIKEIEDEMKTKTPAGYASAKNIFDQGRNSAKSSGKRAISGF